MKNKQKLIYISKKKVKYRYNQKTMKLKDFCLTKSDFNLYI